MESRHTYDTDLIPIGKAANQLGISVDTLRRWAEAGRLPVITLPSGHRRFKASDIAALKESA